MKKLLAFSFIGFLITTVLCSLSFAQEILIPARQIEKGKGSLILYFSTLQDKLNLHLENQSQVQVGGLTYASTASNDFESLGKSQGVGVKFVINPADGLYYWLKLGSGSYGLEIPSQTVKNTYSTQDNGITAGFGIRKRLLADTIVTPAFALDFGFDYSLYNLAVLKPEGGALTGVSDKLELTQFQAAAVISKKYSKFEPYGGIKVLRNYVSLTDRLSLDKIYGYKDNAGIYLGVKASLYESESLVIEGNFFGEESVTIAWNVEF
jgi:hypothetical protein